MEWKHRALIVAMLSLNNPLTCYWAPKITDMYITWRKCWRKPYEESSIRMFPAHWQLASSCMRHLCQGWILPSALLIFAFVPPSDSVSRHMALPTLSFAGVCDWISKILISSVAFTLRPIHTRSHAVKLGLSDDSVFVLHTGVCFLLPLLRLLGESDRICASCSEGLRCVCPHPSPFLLHFISLSPPLLFVSIQPTLFFLIYPEHCSTCDIIPSLRYQDRWFLLC